MSLSKPSSLNYRIAEPSEPDNLAATTTLLIDLPAMRKCIYGSLSASHLICHLTISTNFLFFSSMQHFECLILWWHYFSFCHIVWIWFWSLYIICCFFMLSFFVFPFPSSPPVEADDHLLGPGFWFSFLTAKIDFCSSHHHQMENSWVSNYNQMLKCWDDYGYESLNLSN